MVKKIRKIIAFLIVAAICGMAYAQHSVSDTLPSWNEGPSKKAIIAFVEKVTKPGPNFIPVEDRIAVFDNDGTLWVEQPYYAQLFFTFDRIKSLAPRHPEWKGKEPFKSVLTGDYETIFARDEKDIVKLVMAAHSGITTDQFSAIVSRWMQTARHPHFKRPFNHLTYQPMLELLSYLRTNGFKTYIVSGGGVEFMRPWTWTAYGIPPQNVIGSTGQEKFEVKGDKIIITKEPKPDFVDDGSGKPIAIQRHIGRRPVMAFGNSDGDLQMLQWTEAGKGPRFVAFVHHTDAKREYAYDRKSKIGTLDKALDEAYKKHWLLIDMKKDWKTIFPPENQKN